MIPVPKSYTKYKDYINFLSQKSKTVKFCESTVTVCNSYRYLTVNSWFLSKRKSFHWKIQERHRKQKCKEAKFLVFICKWKLFSIFVVWNKHKTFIKNFFKKVLLSTWNSILCSENFLIADVHTIIQFCVMKNTTQGNNFWRSKYIFFQKKSIYLVCLFEIRVFS